MTAVYKIETFLTVAGRSLDRNFTLRITRPLNNAVMTALVRIKKNYYKANNMAIAAGDKLYLSLSLNGEAKVLLFSGIVGASGETASHVEAGARQDALKTNLPDETYRGISYKEAFGKLADRVDFTAKDYTPEQIVLQGGASNTLLRLINSLKNDSKKPVYYWLKRDGTLKIANAVEGGARYKADDMLVSARADMVEIFPIPELEIGDILEVRGQAKIVAGITMDTTSKAVMRCSII